MSGTDANCSQKTEPKEREKFGPPDQKQSTDFFFFLHCENVTQTREAEWRGTWLLFLWRILHAQSLPELKSLSGTHAYRGTVLPEAGRADGSEAQEGREKGTFEKRQEGRERRKEEKRKEEEGRTFSSLLNVPQAQPRRRQALHADLHSADMLIVCFLTYSIHSDEALVYRRASYTPPRHPCGLLLLPRPL